jgi:hypothetical protein
MQQREAVSDAAFTATRAAEDSAITASEALTTATIAADNVSHAEELALSATGLAVDTAAAVESVDVLAGDAYSEAAAARAEIQELKASFAAFMEKLAPVQEPETPEPTVAEVTVDDHPQSPPESGSSRRRLRRFS